MSYLLNANSLVVHREECPAIRRELREPGNALIEYAPGGHFASPYDEACRRCLPEGLPTP